jgi:phage major head subunit gpT-like protein
MQINKTTLDFLFQQWDQRFQAAFQAQRTYWPNYATLMPSGSSQTVHSWIEQQGGLVEYAGARSVDNIVARDYTLKNRKFQKTIGLDVDKMDDDGLGLFAGEADSLGVQAALWPDDVMTPVVENGKTSVCWDGQYFFDTDHPVDIDDASKGTYSNNLVGASYDFATDAAGAYEKGCQQLAEILGPDGRTHDTVPDLIMVAPRNRKKMMNLLNAEIVKDGNAGVSNVYQGDITGLVNTRLTADPNAVYLMKASGPIKPFLWQLRKAPDLVAKNSPTDDNVFFEDKILYGTKGRGAGGYTFPWLCVRLAPA